MKLKTSLLRVQEALDYVCPYKGAGVAERFKRRMRVL